METLQLVIVGLVIAFAVGYAVWRVRRTLRQDAPCCDGCEGCPFHEEMKKHGCDKKKDCQKFGQSK